MKNILVKQRDIKDCGVCCLLSIMKYYGGEVPIEILRLDTKTGVNGTSAFNLVNTAKKYGFNASGVKTNTLNENIVLPAIAHVQLDNGLNHYVVIYKITDKYIYIMDPGKGYRKEKKEDFYKIFTNILLIFKPYQKIPCFKNSFKISSIFTNILEVEKSLVIKILLLNAIITFLSIFLGYYLKIITSLIETSYINTILYIMILFLTLTIIKIYLNYLRNDLMIYFNKNIDIRVVLDFIDHLFKLPLNVIKNRTSGEILTRVYDLNNVKQLFSEIFISICLYFSLSICSVYFLYSLNSTLFLILCIITITYIIIGCFMAPFIYKKINNNIELETEFNSNLVENIDNIETIKNLNLEDKVLDDIDSNYSKFIYNTFKYNKFLNGYDTLKNIINDFGLFLINSVGLILIFNNKLSLISLITFNSLLNYFIDPIVSVIEIIPKFFLIKLSITKVNEFMSIDEEKIGEVSDFINGDIVIKNISYSYDDFSNIIDNLSLKIKLNDHVMLKGKSGCGKSTLCKMLNLNIDNYKGNIMINNVNLKNYSLKTIRNNIVYVSQREKIFSDTIRNNILLDNNISTKELNDVLNITKVNEILDKKSFKLDSYLYDSGFNLSGGERQRIVLARALVRKPKILILDESFSELDNRNELEILKAIDSYLKDTTLIYVSHSEVNYFKNIIYVGDK